MSIELLPRSPARTAGWAPGAGNSRAGVPELVPVSGTHGVRVDVVGRGLRFRRPRLPGGWFLFVVIVANPFRWLRTGPALWWGAGVLGLLVVLLLYRSLRLVRIAHRQDPDVVLWPGGVRVGGLDVPWSQVEAVVRFRLADHGSGGGGGKEGPSFLGLQVRDFVAVRGLSPFWAGLANLTRRRLVVLADASELRAPDSVARALDRLVAHPEERALLSTDAGVHLVATGSPF